MPEHEASRVAAADDPAAVPAPRAGSGGEPVSAIMPGPALDELLRRADEAGVRRVRVCFVDQHGVPRGKVITRAALASVLRAGLTVPSSLLLKDLSGRSQFAVFSALSLDGYDGYAGAGDIVLVADPASFRVLPWAPHTGLLLADLHYPDGRTVPFCGRGLLRRHLDALATSRGLGLTIGAELEFHVFVRVNSAMDAAQVSQPGNPGAAPAVRPLTRGSQLLHLDALDGVDHLVAALDQALVGLGLPLRSVELEFGPSQFEVTLDAGDAAAVADDVVLTRMAVKQVCRRLGLHATFMSRPLGADTASTGWHLHQSLRRLDTGAPVLAAPGEPGRVLSADGMRYLGGLLEHARAAAAFTTPTVNGYKRYQPFSLAPDRVGWGRDNKGAMVRVVGTPGDPNAHLENRSGEPGANPYLYILSQLLSGLDGIDNDLSPGEPTNSPYMDASAPRLPRNLGEALTALEDSALFRHALGEEVVDWYVRLKRAEFDRYLDAVSDWEQREYFDLL